MTRSEHSGSFINLNEVVDGETRPIWVDPFCIRSFGVGVDGVTFVNYVFGNERVFGSVNETPQDLCKKLSGILKREEPNA